MTKNPLTTFLHEENKIVSNYKSSLAKMLVASKQSFKMHKILPHLFCQDASSVFRLSVSVSLFLLCVQTVIREQINVSSKINTFKFYLFNMLHIIFL